MDDLLIKGSFSIVIKHVQSVLDLIWTYSWQSLATKKQWHIYSSTNFEVIILDYRSEAIILLYILSLINT